MTQKPKRYVTEQYSYYFPDSAFYKKIEERCNKMLEIGYVLEQTIPIAADGENMSEVILIFAEY